MVAGAGAVCAVLEQCAGELAGVVAVRVAERVAVDVAECVAVGVCHSLELAAGE